MFTITPKHDFLVGIDSDGCVFDTMELKHKECFVPNIINHYGLQGVSKYAREAAEFVNLYSKSRGINRFPALIEAARIGCEKRPEVQARGIKIAVPQGPRRVDRTRNEAGQSGAGKGRGRNRRSGFEAALAWSMAVNKSIAEMVRCVPPFPFVRECLGKLAGQADMLVVSPTPNEALEARMGRARSGEVRRGDLRPGDRHQERIARRRQEVSGQSHADDRRRPRRLQSGRGQRRLFFPINPGRRRSQLAATSRRRNRPLLRRHVRRRVSAKLLDEFDTFLPEHPPWELKEMTQ